jgi:hypothetical protein
LTRFEASSFDASSLSSKSNHPWNWLRLVKTSGSRKCSSDQSSGREFCSGVPVSSSLLAVGMNLSSRMSLQSKFFKRWPSSTTRYLKLYFCRNLRSAITISNDVTITGKSCVMGCDVGKRFERISARSCFDPWYSTAGNSGQNRLNSLIQLLSVDRGPRMRYGPEDAFVPQVAQKPNGLHSFPQTHLVGEDAVQTVLVQRHEPPHAFQLVIAHLHGHHRQQLFRLAQFVAIRVRAAAVAALSPRSTRRVSLLGALLLFLTRALRVRLLVQALHLLGEELGVDGGLVEQVVEVRELLLIQVDGLLARVHRQRGSRENGRGSVFTRSVPIDECGGEHPSTVDRRRLRSVELRASREGSRLEKGLF